MPPDSPLLFEDGFHVRVRDEGSPPFYHIVHTSAPDGGEAPSPVPLYGISLFLCPASCGLADGEVRLKPLDVLFLTPDNRPTFAFGEDGARRVSVRFLPPPPDSPMGGDQLHLMDLLARSGPVFRLPPDDMKTLFSCLNDIYAACANPSSLRDMTVHVRLAGLLLALCAARERNTYAAEAPPGPSERKMHDVAAYIRRHYAEPLTLADIAARFYISSFYLSHQFRAVIGVTLTDFIRETRIGNVQALLAATSVPVTEAAMRCGFTSLSQFNRAFRDVVGMSPSQYRKLLSPDSQPPV